MTETTVKPVPPTDSAQSMKPHQHITYVLFMGQPYHYPSHGAASEDATKIHEQTHQKPRIIRSLNVGKWEIAQYELAHEAFALLERCRKFADKVGDVDFRNEIGRLIDKSRSGPKKHHGDI